MHFRVRGGCSTRAFDGSLSLSTVFQHATLGSCASFHFDLRRLAVCTSAQSGMWVVAIVVTTAVFVSNRADLGVHHPTRSRCLVMSPVPGGTRGAVDVNAASSSSASASRQQANYESEEEKSLYALGHHLARKVPSRALTASETNALLRGVQSCLSGEVPDVQLDTYVPRAIGMLQAREKDMAKRAIFEGEALLAAAEAQRGAVRTAGGAVLIVEHEGDGQRPGPYDTVEVHYEGRLSDGTVFDSSYERSQPLEIVLEHAIPGWCEGLMLMKVGSTARLVIPPALGYGDLGSPPRIPRWATLTFDVELLNIQGSASKPDVLQ